MLLTAPPELANALVLRQQLAKSSVKSIRRCRTLCVPDGRARGMFQFYGANRTVDGQADSFKCRICPRTICPTSPKRGGLFAAAIMKP